MAATRAQVEQVLVRRCGRQLALVGLDGATCDGTNPDLADPVAVALAALGLWAADPAAAVDADLAPLGPMQLAALLDLAEVRALESVLGNWDQPDQVADTNNEQGLGRLRDSLERTVARKRLQLERQYGLGLPELSAGVLDLGFAEAVDPATGIPR